VLGGAAYGVLLRAFFGVLPSGTHGAMSAAFLLGTPLAIGAIAVYGSPEARKSLLRAFVEPALPTLFMLLGCAVTLMEGSICLAIMAPLFFFLASVGGVCMGLAFRIVRLTRTSIGAVAALPLALMVVDRGPLPDTFHELRESVVVNAPPEAVWSQILDAKSIAASELPTSLTHLIGVPRPVHALNRVTAGGEVRFSEWEKGVKFSALVVDRQEHRSITWRYSFAPDSFPPGTMDEHVVIGGEYLDLGDTTFNLQALPGGRTRLEVVGRYRLTTAVNFYAVPASRVLGRDFLRTLLGFYKGRAEGASRSG